MKPRHLAFSRLLSQAFRLYPRGSGVLWGDAALQLGGCPQPATEASVSHSAASRGYNRYTHWDTHVAQITSLALLPFMPSVDLPRSGECFKHSPSSRLFSKVASSSKKRPEVAQADAKSTGEVRTLRVQLQPRPCVITPPWDSVSPSV